MGVVVDVIQFIVSTNSLKMHPAIIDYALRAVIEVFSKQLELIEIIRLP